MHYINAHFIVHIPHSHLSGITYIKYGVKNQPGMTELVCKLKKK